MNNHSFSQRHENGHQAGDPDNRPLRILLVEDNPAEAIFIRTMLENARRFICSISHVTTLANGIESLQNSLKFKTPFDLVLLDINLPDSRGLATFRTIYQHAPSVAIILLTNDSDGTLALQAVRQGAQDYLIKVEINASLLTHAVRYAVERKRAEEKLIYNAFHDPLTRLPNRALFIDRLQQALLQNRRHARHPFAVLHIDLDRFKLINDSLGYTNGDNILLVISDRLTGCLRAGDSIARSGGDEFIILLDDVSDATDAVLIAERIQDALQKPLEINKRKVFMTASIGIVIGNLEYESAEDILRDAEIAMYQAKSSGKACQMVFMPSMRFQSQNRLELENDLRQVLETDDRCNQELFVVFQPIIRLHDGHIAGFEALLRWKHPQRGLIPPSEFIPIAEETGLIHLLGLWVLRRVCEQVNVWRKKTAEVTENFPFSINVNFSSKQFSRPELADEISHILRDQDIDPNVINLEITESLLMENDEPVTEKLAKIHNLGIKFQVDDFGRGYSSYSVLQNYPLDTLKIDAAFIHHLDAEHTNSEIVRSIVSLACSLGLSVIAEGVETETQLSKLKELNCQYGQGYYISTPLSADKATQIMLQSWNPPTGFALIQ